MAAETVIIDVQTNYSDRMSPGIDASGQKLDKMMQSIEKMQKQLEKLTGSKANPTVEVNDKATSKLEKVGGLLKSIGSKAIKTTVSIVDKATAPLRGIMNYALSIKGVLTGLATGAAFNTFISSPIALADQIETAQIGFETMLGSADKATKMMDEIKAFAAKTPFDTTGVVSSVQQMMRAGWSADQVMTDIEKIGNAAAAAGQGTEGVQGIVLALQQMSMAGKLNAQDMMQLTNRGVKAWQYVADAMGVTVQEARKMSQDGLIPVETAIQGIIDGMSEYDGMMDKMSTRTVSGLMSNLQDTFDIKIVEKWGKGLVSGATEGLAKFGDFLDSIDPMLQEAGSSLEKWGNEISTAVFDVLENRLEDLKGVFSSTEFKNAGAFEKIQIMWDKVISEPFGKWWDTTGYPWMVKKMGNLGEGLGKGLSEIFKGILGWNAGDSIDDATTIGSSFAKGFLDGFDGSGVTKALTESIKNAIQDALNIFSGNGDGSSWVSAALLGYGGLKAIKGIGDISSLFGGPTAGSLIGKGTGKIFNYLATTTAAGKYGGNIAAMNMAGGGVGIGSQLAAGGAMAGGLVAGATLLSGGHDFYSAIKADNNEEAKAYTKSSAWKVGGVGAGAAAGAAIGTALGGPIVGTLIGAGIGGLVGWYQGSKAIKEYEQSVKDAEEAERQAIITKEKDKYATEEMKEAVEDLANGTITAEQFNQIWKNSAEVSDDLANHFGKLSLSMEEINSMAEKMILGDATKSLNEFASAAEQTQSSLSSLQSSQTSMVKLNWKAQMGFIDDEQSISEFQSGIDSLIQNAKSYVEDSHYEATAAINVFLEPGESADGETSVLNTLYEQINTELSGATEKLQKAVDEALGDGKISPTDTITIEVDGIEVEMNEADAIRTLQDKVTEITDKIANAKHEAKMTQIQVDFQMSDLDVTSWEKLQSAIEEEMASKKVTLEDAFNARVASYNLEFGEGLITQEELDQKTAEATKDYTAKIDEMKAEVEKFNFDSLEQTYGEELNKAFENMNLTGTFEEKFKAAMEGADSKGVNISEYLKFDDSTSEASQENIGQIADSIASKIGDSLKDADYSSASEGITNGLNETLIVGVNDTDVTAPSDALTEKLNGMTPEDGFTFDGMKDGVKTGAENAITEGVNSIDASTVCDPLSELISTYTFSETPSFSGIEGPVKEGIQTAVKKGAEALSLEGDLGVPGKVDSAVSGGMTADKFSGTGGKAASACQSAIKSAFDGTTMTANANIQVTPDISLTKSTFSINASGGATGSTDVELSIGGHAAGGLVGSKVLSWLAEEGYPEFVIPTAPHRRARALDLLSQAEETLGVEKHASGGIVGGMLPASGSKTPSGESSGGSGKNISVNVGGVTISVNTDSGSGDIISQIQAKKAQISSVISEMLAEALEESFENMPLAAQ